MTYFGDGAARQVHHEALTWLCMKLPVVFIVENNGYAWELH
jgi:TPP-dependent pyruvate/acetoin dehydrogenase alpha subunit